jgi:ubiquinone/menaquinone biosynthesis C-methylase UbiE
MLSRNNADLPHSDEELALLPDIDPHHPDHAAWLRRAISVKKLIRYLAIRKQSASILDVGCGNGWLSAQLATVPGSRIVGIDLNFMLLQQAARIFRHHHNLKFIYGDFCSDVLHDLSFDVIVFADSIQYFPSLRNIAGTALQHLKHNGEIHILDTHFSRSSVAAPAFHPCIRDLHPFRYRYLYNPRSLWRRPFKQKVLSPWICIPSQ